ncbi:hypothetical protein IW136_001356 [Coemansia sp. RSA 678]|nr:hypothetical protein IW136_001356 [Coemansia sp. RSA 678]
MPPPQLQQQPYQPAQQAYYSNTLGTSASQQYAYYAQQHTPQSHASAYSQSGSTPASSASGFAPAQARFLNAATSNPQQQFSHQQLGLVAQASPVTSVTPASSVSAATPHSHLPQPFVSPHGIPTSLLGHGSAVANADYGVWFYPHQQIPQTDRPSTVAAVGGVTNSASVSPISQHTIASADQAYPLHGQFDSQMRYMAVPGQPSGLLKPIAQAALPIDRSLRPIQPAAHQQHSLAAMQYQNTGYPAQSQYHSGYYQSQHQPHQQSLHSHIFSGQQHQPLPTQSHSHQQYQQPSPFPTHASALSATAPMSDSSSTQTSIGGPPAASVMHAGSYGAVHPGSADQISTDSVSAAQVAAAVAAVAASAHTIPVTSSVVAVGQGAGASGSGTSGVIGLGNNRLGIGMNEVEHPGMPAFKFSMNMQSGAESHLPDYFESYSQNYMMGNPPLLEPSPASPTEQTLDSDLMVKLDELFMKYLEAICSNNITVDSEGESIHQTQMAKKLEKLEQCTEYRTFRFRIQAFSNGYREFIEREAGLTEQAVSKQQLRNYLHQQHYISRYNEDGKKAKSKGHHVWNVEAKKISRNTWWFKEFLRRIASPPPKAVVGVPYEWTPTIWDPQIKAPKVYFSSEWLPAWLRWENNSLRGLPPPDATDCNIVVVASYYQGKELCHLKTNFVFHVVSHTPSGTMFMP